ncbi:MAG: hypothetical protein R3D97_01355 [Paracoccaceae bacterium]
MRLDQTSPATPASATILPFVQPARLQSCDRRSAAASYGLSAVDLAKEPGLLYRLRAMLSEDGPDYGHH